MEQTNIQQTTGLQVFYNENENVSVRTKVIDGEPWFVAKDVCMMLGIQNSRDTLAKVLDDDEAGVATIYTRSSNGVEQNREVGIINESGLYHLIFISRKPEAKAIRRWVTGTVLPSIRRTGSYSISNNRPESTNRLPLPKFRPYFGQWKENVKPYISRAELCLTAEKQRVTLGHVQKVYAGTSMSYPVAKCIQALAKKNRQEGRTYPEKKPAYEQLCITWEE
ncbi:BRO family protein [Bacteroides mediterraneensis]|uniref:BRO-N domain-containing protein n=1 Tax=Bacteroides mediterraneensis TaxID=1841856 RepID=UPI0026EA3476|nr:BRO family protein [Bacteroides mediterraneensis]